MKSSYRVVLEEVEAPTTGAGVFDEGVGEPVESASREPKVVRREVIFTTDEVPRIKRVKNFIKTCSASAVRGVAPKDIVVMESTNEDFPKGTVFHGYAEVAAKLGYSNAQSVSTAFQNSKRDKRLYTKLRGVTLVHREAVGAVPVLQVKPVESAK